VRNAFSEALYTCAKDDPRIMIVVADISPAGSMAKLRDEYPDRFINVGVAEQVMIGICAGLALRGQRPFAYTIATFTLFRPFEMVRVDLCYQNLPVTVVGMGSGIVYSTLGGTHHTMEDIAIASALPNMRITRPCDPLEVLTACNTVRFEVRVRRFVAYLESVRPRRHLSGASRPWSRPFRRRTCAPWHIGLTGQGD